MGLGMLGTSRRRGPTLTRVLWPGSRKRQADVKKSGGVQLCGGAMPPTPSAGTRPRFRRAVMNKNMLAVALASLLVGGVAVAAYNSFADDDRVATATASDAAALGLDADFVEDGAIDGIEYAEAVN